MDRISTMAAIQLNFTLRTSSGCKTVHLLGSWDNYAGQLPLSKDPKKSGGWLGCFKFPGATLKQGQRYWYYVCCSISIATAQQANRNSTSLTATTSVMTLPKNIPRNPPLVANSTSSTFPSLQHPTHHPAHQPQIAPSAASARSPSPKAALSLPPRSSRPSPTAPTKPAK